MPYGAYPGMPQQQDDPYGLGFPLPQDMGFGIPDPAIDPIPQRPQLPYGTQGADAAARAIGGLQLPQPMGLGTGFLEGLANGWAQTRAPKMQQREEQYQQQVASTKARNAANIEATQKARETLFSSYIKQKEADRNNVRIADAVADRFGLPRGTRLAPEELVKLGNSGEVMVMPTPAQARRWSLPPGQAVPFSQITSRLSEEKPPAGLTLQFGAVTPQQHVQIENVRSKYNNQRRSLQSRIDLLNKQLDSMKPPYGTVSKVGRRNRDRASSQIDSLTTVLDGLTQKENDETTAAAQGGPARAAGVPAPRVQPNGADQDAQAWLQHQLAQNPAYSILQFERELRAPQPGTGLTGREVMEMRGHDVDAIRRAFGAHITRTKLGVR